MQMPVLGRLICFLSMAEEASREAPTNLSGHRMQPKGVQNMAVSYRHLCKPHETAIYSQCLWRSAYSLVLLAVLP